MHACSLRAPRLAKSPSARCCPYLVLWRPLALRSNPGLGLMGQYSNPRLQALLLEGGDPGTVAFSPFSDMDMIGFAPLCLLGRGLWAADLFS